MKNKIILTLFTALVVLGLLVGCGTAEEPAPAEEQTMEEEAEAEEVMEEAPEELKTIAFWVRDYDLELPQSFADAWNAEHPNVQVEIVGIPGGEIVMKLGASIAAGEPPDLIKYDLIDIPILAKNGQLTDLTQMARSLPYYEYLTPAHVQLGLYEGKNYALPASADPSIVVYNKGLFEQAGLDPESPPTTWDEVIEYAQAITDLGEDYYGFYFSGSCAGCNAYTFMPAIWASGGNVLNEDASAATIISDPAVREALEYYKEMWDKGFIPEGAEVDGGENFEALFHTDKIGMVILGNWTIKTISENAPDIDFGFAPIPGKDGGISSFGGGDSFAIPAGSRYVEEAFEFLKFVYSEEIQLKYFAGNKNIPLRSDLYDNPTFEEDPRLKVSAKALDVSQAPYSFVYHQIFNDPNGPWSAMIQTAIFDGDVDGALETAQEEFTRIIESE
jgi:multiple sugar transport system substrate-binding protein